jgi:hypothetical protein
LAEAQQLHFSSCHNNKGEEEKENKEYKEATQLSCIKAAATLL